MCGVGAYNMYIYVYIVYAYIYRVQLGNACEFMQWITFIMYRYNIYNVMYIIDVYNIYATEAKNLNFVCLPLQE